MHAFLHQYSQCRTEDSNWLNSIIKRNWNENGNDGKNGKHRLPWNEWMHAFCLLLHLINFKLNERNCTAKWINMISLVAMMIIIRVWLVSHYMTNRQQLVFFSFFFFLPWYCFWISCLKVFVFSFFELLFKNLWGQSIECNFVTAAAAVVIVLW